MRWATVQHGGETVHGRVVGEQIEVVGTGDLFEVVRAGGSSSETLRTVPLAEVTVLSPLLRPGKVVAVAANYQSHVTEAGGAERTRSKAAPRLFLKPDTAVIGDGVGVRIPPITHKLDWEVEIAVVIGGIADHVSVDDALGYVFGYTVTNDISARGLDLPADREVGPFDAFSDWLMGKFLDGSAPLGPYITTADEFPDPQNMRLWLDVNGVRKQDGNSSDMVHRVDELIAFISRFMTLNPGDVILTGTPAGVGATTGEYLNVGDVMVAGVEGVGELTTPVI